MPSSLLCHIGLGDKQGANGTWTWKTFQVLAKCPQEKSSACHLHPSNDNAVELHILYSTVCSIYSIQYTVYSIIAVLAFSISLYCPYCRIAHNRGPRLGCWQKAIVLKAPELVLRGHCADFRISTDGMPSKASSTEWQAKLNRTITKLKNTCKT